jgi:hypothetical protein
MNPNAPAVDMSERFSASSNSANTKKNTENAARKAGAVTPPWKGWPIRPGRSSFVQLRGDKITQSPVVVSFGGNRAGIWIGRWSTGNRPAGLPDTRRKNRTAFAADTDSHRCGIREVAFGAIGHRHAVSIADNPAYPGHSLSQTRT